MTQEINSTVIDVTEEARRLGESGLWRTVRNIGWVSVARMIRMGGALLVGTRVARYLGPAQYGSFSYAYAIYGLFNIISNLGLDYLVVNEIALSSNVETEERILGTAMIMKVAASILTTLAAVAYTSFSHAGNIVVLIVAMLSAASISQGFDVIDYFFQAKTRSKLTVIPQITVFLLSSAARLFAVIHRGSLLVFGLIGSLDILGVELGLALVYWRGEGNLLRWSFDKSRAVSMLRTSWPLLLASLLIIVYMRTDQILLGVLSTKVVVGQYSAAVKMSELWYAVPSLVCSSVMPRLLRHKEAAPQTYYARLQRLYDLLAASSIVIALGVSLFGKYAVLMLFGAAYAPAAMILSVHVWTAPFVFIGVAGGMQLIQEKLTSISLQRSCAGAVCNIVLNLLLIPRFGGVGSAVGTLTTQILASYLMDGFNKKTMHIFRMKTRALLGLWLLPSRLIAAQSGPA